VDPITAKIRADVMRQHRFHPFLFRCTWEYRSWSDQMRYDYDERIGMIVGSDPIVTAEGHVYALDQVTGDGQE
jgi:hypothetical protein